LIVITNDKSFTVKEKNNGKSNIKFSYRIVAKRENFQDHRFGNDPVWGPGNTKQYSSYAEPTPVDYYDAVRFWENKKRTWKPDLLPPTIAYPQKQKYRGKE
jgi:hypothetical protein